MMVSRAVARLRRSLLAQLLSIYLLFVGLVLGAGLVLSALLQRQLISDSRASNLALAQAVAREVAQRMQAARGTIIRLTSSDGPSLTDLASRASAGGSPEAQAQMRALLRDFKNANRDASVIYWLDGNGVLRMAVPEYPSTVGLDFSRQAVFRASQTRPDVQVAFGLDFTTLEGVAMFAVPLRDFAGRYHGLVSLNVPLERFNAPLEALAEDRSQRGEPVFVHVVAPGGNIVATSDFGRVDLNDASGEREVLSCSDCTIFATDPNGSTWLLSSAPVGNEDLRVIVRRPATSALATLNSLNTWLLVAAVLFGAGGLLFWIVLLRRVIQPLGALTLRQRTLLLGDGRGSAPAQSAVALREDEMGELARAISRLEGDVSTRLAELGSLLDTSRAVVGSLDPGEVSQVIIRAARTLVTVDAAAVLVPDATHRLRILASEGRDPATASQVAVALDDPLSPSARAFRTATPVQITAPEDGQGVPLPSFQEGFRSALSIPILSQRLSGEGAPDGQREVGGVVLHVARLARQPFTRNEIDLLTTFANYAALAWEHAVLYERSDVRLRQVAAENQRLYQQALEDKQTLLAAIGHELRTPLAAIKGHASTLMQPDVSWPAADQRHFIHTISDEADRMAGLLNHLLDLARQEAGLLALNRIPCSLRGLVDQVMQRLPEDPGIRIDIGASIPDIDVDPQRIQVVLANLINNAIQYGEGEIAVSAGLADQAVIVRVSDQGPGIPPGEMEHLFERFHRAQRGRDRRTGGSGLGLAICRAFVLAHGGKLWAESSPAGTTVSFSVPVGADAGGGRQHG